MLDTMFYLLQLIHFITSLLNLKRIPISFAT